MMLAFSREVTAGCTVYDCMDELSAFRFVPPGLLALEAELLAAADLVFTGGYSLYEAKRERHSDVRDRARRRDHRRTGCIRGGRA